MNLLDLQASLSVPRGAEFSARQVSGSDYHFVARDSHGQLAILVGAKDLSAVVIPPIKLREVEVHFGVLCKVSLPDGSVRECRFAVLKCVSQEWEVERYFLSVGEAIIRLIGPSPAASTITGAIRRVVDLFQRLHRPPSRQVAGLYGELLLIAWSDNPARAMRAWRSEQFARYDFAVEDARLDVKTSLRRTRSHKFSLEQCQPPPGTVGLFASLLLDSSSGASVAEVMQRIETALAGEAELILKLHEIVADTLGTTIVEGLATRFNDRAARASLRYYFASSVPMPGGPIPEAVSEIKFRADLTSTQSVSGAELLALAPALSCLISSE